MSYIVIDPLLRAALEPRRADVLEQIATQALRINEKLLAERKPRKAKRKVA